MQFSDYLRPAGIEEAWQLNQKRTNRVLGGNLWLKMGPGKFRTAIDLCDLGLDHIEETDDAYCIGSMVSLHALECHEGLNALTHGAIKEALEGIVGIQFRNCATLGGSLWRRAGFSDVLTVFMALNATVMLHKGGAVNISDFAAMKPDRDIITHVIVPRTPIAIAYLSMRNTKTDFPVLTCCVVRRESSLSAVIGARPLRAVRIECPPQVGEDAFPAYVQESLTFGDDLRASAAYRRHLTGVLVKRALKTLGGEQQ